MNFKESSQFTNYCASLVILANHLKDTMSITTFISAFVNDESGAYKEMFDLLVSLRLVQVDSWYGNGKPKEIRWSK